MWTIEKKSLKADVTQYKIAHYNTFISYQDWIDYLTDGQHSFITFFNHLLQSSSYKAFFWEVKPITVHQLHQAFEFVLVESRILPNIQTNRSAFSQYFNTQEQVVSFPNLGRDAQLVVPTLRSKFSNYNHLASFVRNAPEKQILCFWQKVGEQYGLQLTSNTNQQQQRQQQVRWLSTAGLGVYWLHVRIDTRPKYYRFAPYKKI